MGLAGPLTTSVAESEFIKSFRAGNIPNIYNAGTLPNIYTAGIVNNVVQINVEQIAEQISYCRQLLSNDGIMTKLKTSNFDLLVADMSNVCEVLLPEALQIPFVALTAASGDFMPLANYYRSGFPMELSYRIAPISQLLQTIGRPITFFARVINVLFSWTIIPLIQYNFASKFKALQEEFNISPDEDIITLANRKPQFWLAHVSLMFDDPYPGMPNWCSVGGMAAARTNPLPRVSVS